MDEARATDVSSDASTPRWWRWALLGIVAVGVAVRLAFALEVAPDLPVPGDAQVYREMAEHLRDGEGLALGRPGDGVVEPTAEHPPLFPSVLAALDLVGLGSIEDQRVGLSVVAGLSVAAMGLLGRRVAGPGAGLAAAGIAAVHPLWIQPPGMVMSESLHLALVPVVLLACLDAARRSGWQVALLLGALVGVVSLGRPESLGLLALAALPAVLAATAGWRSRLAMAALLVFGAGLIVAPWVVRNADAVGAPVLATNSGKTILGSNCDDTYGGRALGGFSYDCFFGSATVLVEFGPPGGGTWTGRTLDDEMGRVGRAYISDHLGDQPRVVAARLARMWGLAFADDQLAFDVYEGRHRRLQRWGQWAHLALLPAAAIGVWRTGRRERAAMLVLLGPVVLVSAATLLVYGGSRMRSSAEPSLAVLAAVGAVWVAEQAVLMLGRRKG